MKKASNRNTPNYKKFFEEEALRKKQIAEREQRVRLERMKANLKTFLEDTPDVLVDVSYRMLPDTIKKGIIDLKMKENPDKYILITSGSKVANRMVGHALVRGFIESGKITPNEVRRTSLIEAYDNATGMFTERDWKEYFFDYSAKLVIIDGISASMARLHHRNESQFWREFMEFARQNELIVILMYDTHEADNSHDRVGVIPTLSGIKELNKELLIQSRYLRLSREEEEKLHDEQRKS